MQDKIASLKNTARFAGILYLIIILTSVYGHMYVPLQIFVKGDAAATANNILENEFLFRSCIVAGLVETTAFLWLGLTLYRLLKDINIYQARLMVALVGIQVPLALVFSVLKFMALMTLKNEVINTLPSAEPPEIAVMYLNIIRYGSTVLGIVAGLWLLPLGMLIYKARFVPSVLGILVIVAGAGNAIHSLLAVLYPAYPQSPLPAFVFFVLGEVPIMIWLLIKGVKDHISIPVFSERNIISHTLPKAIH